jgi:hypothetical protein
MIKQASRLGLTFGATQALPEWGRSPDPCPSPLRLTRFRHTKAAEGILACVRWRHSRDMVSTVIIRNTNASP